MKEENTGLIILAAGGSSRLGQPKQLLPYEGKTLLNHTIDVATDSIAGKVIVVLGAHADQIIKKILLHEVQTVVNSNWHEGIGSSIRAGLYAMIKTKPLVKGAVIMLCDQPFVTVSLIDDLITIGQLSDKLITASKYGGIIGVPAWFRAVVFPDLARLKGDLGARVVIRNHMHEVATIPFPRGSFDIDTERDYEIIIKRKDDAVMI